MVDIKYERSNEKVNSGQMLIPYEVTNFGLTYFNMTVNNNIKDRQLECLPSGKVRCCARGQCLISFIRV